MTKGKRGSLLKQRQQLVAALPPLAEVVRGTVFERHLTCGKKYCHCARGERHRVWCLTVTSAPAVTEQISLPRELVPKVQGQVKNYRRLLTGLEKIAAINRALIRGERANLRLAARPK